MSSQSNSSAGIPGALLPSPGLPLMGPNFGALLVGTFISLILYGVELHQMYRYARLYHRDPVFLKCYVGILFILDTFHTGICVHASYWYLVTNFFDPISLGTPIWSLNMQALVMALVIVACQLYYARRVYLLDRKFRPLVAVVGILCLTELGFGAAFTAEGFILMDITTLRQLAWLQASGFGVIIVVDIALTAVLTLSLHRIRTGFKGTDDKIDVLIAYALCTGLLTNFIAIACFILDRAAPGEMLFIAADTVYAKVYINSVLATMNTRRDSLGGNGPSAQEVELSTLSKHTPTNIMKPWTSPSAETMDERSTVIDIKVDHGVRAHSTKEDELHVVHM